MAQVAIMSISSAGLTVFVEESSLVAGMSLSSSQAIRL